MGKEELYMKVADYIFNYYYSKGIDTVFTVVGGGAMYLNDALTRSKMTVVCTHGEQAASYTAVGYSKLTNKPCIVLVTSGCGSTNAITGLLTAYQDSVPVIFISGQVNSCDMIKHSELRQKGIQESNILEIVDSIVGNSALFDNVKYIKNTNVKYIKNTLESLTKELFTNERKYPIWIDVPLDVQNMEV
jgi:acetolactate synthase-1/2/3 large subunit